MSSRSLGGLGLGLVAWLAFASLCPPAALAEDAESLVRRGVALRRQGKEREALEVFRQAAAIEKSPRVLAQMGLAEQSLGLWVAAEAHMKEALAATSDGWIQKNRKALADAWAVIEDHVGGLEVWGKPDAAEILIDGEKIGALPSSGEVRLLAGEVTFTVRANGYKEVTRPVTVRKGALVREYVELRAQPGPRAGTTTTVASLGATGTGAGAGATGAGTGASDTPMLIDRPGATPPARDESSPVYARWWFWALVGAVAVGGVTTAVLLTRSSNDGMGCDPGVPCGSWGAP